MQTVPLQAVASQTVTVTLNSQACTINVYAKSTGVYLDLYVSGVLVIGGVICRDNTLIVRDAYLGFSGDLAFVDQQGTDDPQYTGIGARWVLFYFLPGDL